MEHRHDHIPDRPPAIPCPLRGETDAVRSCIRRMSAFKWSLLRKKKGQTSWQRPPPGPSSPPGAETELRHPAAEGNAREPIYTPRVRL